MSKKILNFLVILSLIVFVSNFELPILNKSLSFQAYAISEDLSQDINSLFKSLDLEREILNNWENDWKFTFMLNLNSPQVKAAYKSLYEQTVNLEKIAYMELNNAQAYLMSNDLANAKKSLDRAQKYYFLMEESNQALSKVREGSIASAQDILNGIQKGFTESFSIVASFTGIPPWISTAFSTALEGAVNLQAKGLSEATKEAFFSVVADAVFTKVLPSELQNFASWDSNTSVFDVLKNISESEEIQKAVLAKLEVEGIKDIGTELIHNIIFSTSDTLESGGITTGMVGGGGGGSWGQNLDKVQLSSPQDAVALQPGNITFSWEPVSNATKYQLVVYDYLDRIVQNVTTSKYSTSTSINFGTEGTYTWIVRAGDDYGNWGASSDTRSVIIRNTSTQPYFRITVDRGCGSTYKIGDLIKISGESNVTANGTVYSYWSDGSVKTYPASFSANQTVQLVSSPLDGATGLRRYKVVISYNGVTYESNECSINIASSGGTPPGAFTLALSPSCNGTAPQIRLDWTNSSGVTPPYIIYRNGTQYDTTTGNYYINTNVTAGTTYTYYVVAKNNYGSTASNTLSATAPTCSNQNVTLTLYICENSASGPPLSGVSVGVVDGGGHSFSQTTNSSGYITITGTPGTWSFSAMKSGYDTNNWSQSITTTCTKYGYIVKSATPVGSIDVFATLDGSSWTGSLNYSLTGPSSSSGSTVPTVLSNKPVGSYSITFNSGGPPNASLSSITPSSTQTLSAGGVILFTFNFVTQAPQNVTLTLYICENSASGPPLSGVSVGVVDGGGHSFSQTTNSSGYITITGTPGTWSFSAMKSGYDTNNWSQSITTTCTKYGYIVKSATQIGQVQLSSPGNGSTLPPMNVTFIWNSVSYATKYEIIIYNHLGQVALDQTTTNLYMIVALGTEETITWKVRAGDNSGNWGAWSSTWSLTLKK
jgi:hypothetical protein